MVRVQEIPLILLMLFILVYSTVGDPDSMIWSGGYFIAQNTAMLSLFVKHDSPTIRVIGISLSVSTLIFVFIRYFTSFEVERWYSAIPFTICLIGVIALEKLKYGKHIRRKNSKY